MFFGSFIEQGQKEVTIMMPDFIPIDSEVSHFDALLQVIYLCRRPISGKLFKYYE